MKRDSKVDLQQKRQEELEMQENTTADDEEHGKMLQGGDEKVKPVIKGAKLKTAVAGSKEADEDERHKVMKFNILQASVRAYQRNLNTHKTYKEFRQARAQLRDEGKELDSIILSQYLDKYAETGQQYVKILRQIIEQNNLKDFDNVKLLPSSLELESLIQLFLTIN